MDTVIHCNIEKNARMIAMILDFDEEGKECDWHEQHIANAAKYYEERIEKLENRLNHPEIPDYSAMIEELPKAVKQIEELDEDPDIKLALSFEGNVINVISHSQYLKELKAKGEAIRKAGWEGPKYAET